MSRCSALLCNDSCSTNYRVCRDLATETCNSFGSATAIIKCWYSELNTGLKKKTIAKKIQISPKIFWTLWIQKPKVWDHLSVEKSDSTSDLDTFVAGLEDDELGNQKGVVHKALSVQPWRWNQQQQPPQTAMKLTEVPNNQPTTAMNLIVSLEAYRQVQRCSWSWWFIAQEPSVTYRQWWGKQRWRTWCPDC